MALSISFTYTINEDGDTITVTDATGEYSGSNTGGYGSTNENLNDLALLGIAFRTKRDSTQEDLVAVTPADQLHHDNAAADSKVNTFTFTYGTDGTVKLGIVALEAWDTGVTYRSTAAAVIGDYYYDSVADAVKVATDVTTGSTVTGTLVTDYTLFAESALQAVVAQTITEYLLHVNLTIKLGDQWQDYKDYREQVDGAELARTAMDNFKDLRMRLIGANYDFDSGLITESRREIKDLTAEY